MFEDAGFNLFMVVFAHFFDVVDVFLGFGIVYADYSHKNVCRIGKGQDLVPTLCKIPRRSIRNSLIYCVSICHQYEPIEIKEGGR